MTPSQGLVRHPAEAPRPPAIRATHHHSAKLAGEVQAERRTVLAVQARLAVDLRRTLGAG